jgi:hypothetical protein
MDTVGLKIEQKFAIVFESLVMFLKVLLCFATLFELKAVLQHREPLSKT